MIASTVSEQREAARPRYLRYIISRQENLDRYIILDFSIAFDRVPHQRLLKKPYRYYISVGPIALEFQNTAGSSKVAVVRECSRC